MRVRSITSLAPPAVALLAAACAPEPTEAPLARVDLAAATRLADPRPIGVAVDPAGARFVFDENAGLYRIDPDTSATLLLPAAQLPDPGVAIRLPFTDLVALGANQFAITAIGDGFLLDTAAGTLGLHFCYEPGGFPEDREQRTDALTYDPATNRLYAQPRTFDQDGVLVDSLIGEYDRPTGDAIGWYEMPDRRLAAGGMAMIPDRGLVLGIGSRLERFDLGLQRLERVDDLTRFGVGTIEGLAVDHAAGTLLVLDGTDDELVEIELARIGP